MKSLLSIFLLVIIFIQTFSTYMLSADYLLNKNYVAANLCENKNKPQMHCNGKCYLAKQLDKQNKQDNQSADSRKEKFEVQQYFLPVVVSVQREILIVEKEYAGDVINFFSGNFNRQVFHPPAVQA